MKGSSKTWAKPIAMSRWAGAHQHHLRSLQRKLSREAYKSEFSTDYLFLSESILKRCIRVKSPNKQKAKIWEATVLMSPSELYCAPSVAAPGSMGVLHGLAVP